MGKSMKKINFISVGICFGGGVIKKGADVMASNTLARIKHALTLYREGKINKVFCTGGIFIKDQQIPVAELMQEYLLKNGVPKSDVFVETESVDTIENIKFTFILLKETSFFKKISLPEKISLVFISEEHHLKRIEVSIKAYLEAYHLIDYVSISFEPVLYQLLGTDIETEKTIYDHVLADPLGQGDFFEKVRQERRQK
jgi:hypothetical protein